jgi:microcystin-dependent protein
MSNILGGPGGTGPADNRPLTDQEFQLVQRLLSDPLSFPLEFKAWLVAYLESSDLTLPMNSILGLQRTLGITGAGDGTLGIFPAGIILPYGGDTPPAGALLCNGNAYPRASEARLYAAIGTKFGAPDSSSFNVPDLRGRTTVGIGPNADVASQGMTEGAALADRSPKHSHALPGDTSGNMSTPGTDGWIGLTDYGPTAFSHPEANKPLNAPAFLVVNFIIVK